MPTGVTEEELQLIQDFIILPIMLSIVDKKLHEVTNDVQPLRFLFEKTTEILADRIHKDLVEVRRKLKQSNIKVWQEDHVTTYEYQYLCRGYQFTFTMRREKVKAEISMRLPKYISTITDALK